MLDFAAIDFETANAERCSVCSVGIVIVKDGEIVDKFYSLLFIIEVSQELLELSILDSRELARFKLLILLDLQDTKTILRRINGD